MPSNATNGGVTLDAKEKAVKYAGVIVRACVLTENAIIIGMTLETFDNDCCVFKNSFSFLWL